MSETFVSRILKIKSDMFLIDTPTGCVPAKSRKKNKQAQDFPVTGDFVEISYDGSEYIVEKVLPRKNKLIRPSVANVDRLAAIVAKEPEIDYFVIDKLLVNAHKQGMEVILCLNKTDLEGSKALFEELKYQFGADAEHIVTVSAASGDCAELLPLLKNKLTAFAGQSAVGKSSLSNLLLDGDIQAVGELSVRTSRGKNTTTSGEIFALFGGGFIIDTPGFSLLDVHGVDGTDLALYYNDYVKLSSKCRFRMCSHTGEPDCEVIRQVNSGALSRKRYDRYAETFGRLKKVKTYEKKF